MASYPLLITKAIQVAPVRIEKKLELASTGGTFRPADSQQEL